MSLPIRTTLEDIQKVCGYLAKKPTGATLKEAKAVLDARYLDGRKLSALKFWGLIEGDERFKLTPKGRDAVKDNCAHQTGMLAEIVREIEPYRAIIERMAHRNEESLSAVDVAAHWHDHFKDQVSENDKILNDQAVCFFQLASGAGLGNVIIGRKGSPTRLELDRAAANSFIDGKLTTVGRKPELGSDGSEKAKKESAVQGEAPPPLTEHERGLGRGIFVAHGKNKHPLEQLKKILDQFKIPYRVAVDEPNLGRPIGTKVQEIMQTCNCAILVFTADEEFRDKDGTVVWRPSENVIYELGAASYLYGNRIVILKEAGVDFPTNFRDIGYIPFDKDQLEAKSIEVLKELIGFGIVKVST